MLQALKIQIRIFLMMLCFISGSQTAYAALQQYPCKTLIPFLNNYFSTAIWKYDMNQQVYSAAINQQLPVGFKGAGNLQINGMNLPENTNPNLKLIQINPNEVPGCLYQIGNPAILGNNEKNFMLYAIE